MTGFVYFPPASPPSHDCPRPNAEDWPLGSIWLCECGQHWVVKLPPPPPIEGARLGSYVIRNHWWRKISRHRVRRILRKEREERAKTMRLNCTSCGFSLPYDDGAMSVMDDHLRRNCRLTVMEGGS